METKQQPTPKIATPLMQPTQPKFHCSVQHGPSATIEAKDEANARADFMAKMGIISSEFPIVVEAASE